MSNHDHSNHGGHGKKGGHGHHHIMSTAQGVKVFAALIALTVVTVLVAKVDLGPLNLLVALLVATTKALLVCLIFMGLFYDKKTNALIFFTSFLFLIIFIGLTAFDWYFRGDVYVKGDIMGSQKAAPSRFQKPWEPNAEILAYGKQLFAENGCWTCHGQTGAADGPASAGTTTPPRNFTVAAGWKNGRKPSGVAKTLAEGIKGTSMASYGHLSLEQRFAIGHFVMSLGPKPAPVDSKSDLAAIGVDPSKAAGAEAPKPSIPIKLAMQRLAEEGDAPLVRKTGLMAADHPGAGTYRANCLECHGSNGQGGRIRGLGGQAVLVASALTADRDSVRSADRFIEVVTQGLPGVMPGHARLSSSQLRDLHGYVKTITAK
jgi:caa(3)-type oxidase subunit IV